MKYLISSLMSVALGATSVSGAVTATHYKTNTVTKAKDVNFNLINSIGSLDNVYKYGFFTSNITISKSFYEANPTLNLFENNLVKDLAKNPNFSYFIFKFSDESGWPGLDEKVANSLKPIIALEWSKIQQDFKTTQTSFTFSYWYLILGFYTDEGLNGWQGSLLF